MKKRLNCKNCKKSFDKLTHLNAHIKKTGCEGGKKITALQLALELGLINS